MNFSLDDSRTSNRNPSSSSNRRKRDITKNSITKPRLQDVKCGCTWKYVFTCVYTSVCLYSCVCICIRVRTYVHVYIWTYIYVKINPNANNNK